jgi:thioredoxin 1
VRDASSSQALSVQRRTIRLTALAKHINDHARHIHRQGRKEKGACMAELKITATNFETEVLHSTKPVLIDFYADWCGPCKMLSPIVHEIAEEYADTLKVGKVNVDEQMDLAMRFNVSSIPMLALIQNGKMIDQSIGYCPKEDILAMLKKL